MKYAVFSDKYILNRYLRLLNLLISHNRKVFLSIKTTLRSKLVLTNKKTLLRFSKKLFKPNTISNIINSYLVLSYCLLKRYFFEYSPWSSIFNLRTAFFFIYHFLTLYRGIFTIKMIFDWFPIKNWDRASPLKRFVRRVTLGWTKQFENVFPSMVAWVIVINIIPIALSLIETFYITNDFASFPMSYQFEELLEFVVESNLLPSKHKII